MAYADLGRNPTVISHNVEGMKLPEKRTTLLRELKKGKPKFVFLQETHFKTNHIPRHTDSYFTEAHHATNDMSKSKGVSILVSKDVKCELSDKVVDPGGRFIFLKGKCNGIPLTLANAYFPNTAHLELCRKLTKELLSFSTGGLILGVDFNIPLNPLVDTSSGKTYVTYRILKSIKTLLYSLNLIDTWCFFHPYKDFAFYSIPHDRHSRIDYLFISQRDLHLLNGVHIGLQTISDHAPISIALNFSEPSAKSNI